MRIFLLKIITIIFTTTFLTSEGVPLNKTATDNSVTRFNNKVQIWMNLLSGKIQSSLSKELQYYNDSGVTILDESYRIKVLVNNFELYGNYFQRVCNIRKFIIKNSEYYIKCEQSRVYQLKYGIFIPEIPDTSQFDDVSLFDSYEIESDSGTLRIGNILISVEGGYTRFKIVQNVQGKLYFIAFNGIIKNVTALFAADTSRVNLEDSSLVSIESQRIFLGYPVLNNIAIDQFTGNLLLVSNKTIILLEKIPHLKELLDFQKNYLLKIFNSKVGEDNSTIPTLTKSTVTAKNFVKVETTTLNSITTTEKLSSTITQPTIIGSTPSNVDTDGQKTSQNTPEVLNSLATKDVKYTTKKKIIYDVDIFEPITVRISTTTKTGSTNITKSTLPEISTVQTIADGLITTNNQTNRVDEIITEDIITTTDNYIKKNNDDLELISGEVPFEDFTFIYEDEEVVDELVSGDGISKAEHEQEYEKETTSTKKYPSTGDGQQTLQNNPEVVNSLATKVVNYTTTKEYIYDVDNFEPITVHISTTTKTGSTDITKSTLPEISTVQTIAEGLITINNQTNRVDETITENIITTTDNYISNTNDELELIFGEVTSKDYSFVYEDEEVVDELVSGDGISKADIDYSNEDADHEHEDEKEDEDEEDNDEEGKDEDEEDEDEDEEDEDEDEEGKDEEGKDEDEEGEDEDEEDDEYEDED